jgi:SAM-dependent methyltransferase
MIKLDLGAGEQSPEGFIPLGNVNGSHIFPLPYADASVDCIRASHVLEHFPHAQIADVLKEWTRVLKPGGELRIAVPNFEWIAENYVAGQPINTQGYVMGGQVDEADYHKATFDKRSLTQHLAAAGLMLIREWKSELQDCAALPVSLNLCGTKPHQSSISVSAVMSVPRLASKIICSVHSRRCRRWG